MTEDWRDETMADRASDRTDAGATVAPAHVVVIAIDFSLPARRALAWALDYAQHVPSTLHTVHVIDRRFQLSDLSTDPAALRGELGDAERLAASELRTLNDEGRARVGVIHEHVGFGKPADEFLRVARDLGASLLVIGSHGRESVAHMLVGSVAERVVRGADCPVVVVKHRNS